MVGQAIVISGGSRIDCRGGPSIPPALARAKFYVLRPLLDRLRMTYVLPVRPTRKLASLAIIIITSRNASIVGRALVMRG